LGGLCDQDVMHDVRVNRQYVPLRPQFEATGGLIGLAQEAFTGTGEVAIGAPK
jgi:hypothetical protein